MADDLTVLDGSTFFVSELGGDVEATLAQGFFHDDMRHLSRWRLLIDGAPVTLLSSRAVDYYSARVYSASDPNPDEGAALSVRRDRFVGGGVHEDIHVYNHRDERRRVHLELCFGSDFGDIFECKTTPKKRGKLSTELRKEEATALLWYERDGFRRGTAISFGQECRLSEDRVSFELELEPRGEWKACIDITPIIGAEEHRPRQRCGDFRKPQPQMPLTLAQWLDAAPRLETDFDALRHVYRQSLIDLAALRFRPSEELTWSLPAGGVPWFMALFGRDSIIAAYQALPFQARLAQTTLEALAELQATERDDFRDAEPGKILHELRRGELATLGEYPHTPYYGAHDATPLFLILLDEYERWTGDAELVRRLEPNARAALAWLEQEGDLDGDGYLEYEKRSPKGLDNQCWKDSGESILSADGRRARPPIATCELQGYAYDARRRTARLARAVWHDAELADRLEHEAHALRERFNDDFWSEERGHYVLALDDEKRQVDSLTSNIGHLLWSGVVADERAQTVVARLLAPDMFTGWGIRTMSADDRGYNPLAYHTGTVWPFDTAFAAEGMRRYGFREEASRLSLALLEAAAAFDYRLPELFAGFPRDETETPVEYPQASRPQAFSAGAPLLGIRTLLGLDVVDGQLQAEPHLPATIGELGLRGVVRGVRRDVP